MRAESEVLKKVRELKLEIIKVLLSKCNEEQQMTFKRMYAHQQLQSPIDEVVNKMPEDKLDRAMVQCERTVKKNVSKYNIEKFL